MNDDPLKIVGETFEHLRLKPVGHAKVAILQFVSIQFIVWTTVCLGMFAAIGALVATDGNEGAQAVVMLGVWGGIFGLMFLLLPPLMLFLYGYQAATLAEVDGIEDVGPGAVFRQIRLMAMAMLGMMVIQCGLGMVGLMMCYIGAIFTALPLRYAFLLKVDRHLSVMDAIAAAWEGFWAKPGAHFASFGTVFVLSMILSYIPLIGPLIAWPVLAVFEAKSFRKLYGKNGEGGIVSLAASGASLN